MKPTPKEIKRLGTNGIKITWGDDTVHEIPSGILRDNCPSATSRAQRGDKSHDMPLTGKSLLKVVSHTKDEQLSLVQIWAVGNYALGMEWGDGHNTGIYSFDLLYELGQLAARKASL